MNEKRKALQTTISKLVKEIEEDSNSELNIESSLFSILKDRVKGDAEDSRTCVEILLEFLKFNSSHTRRCALTIIDFFYSKSPRFRECMNNFLYEIIVNAAEIEPLKKPLPPPKKDAIDLKIACIKIFQKWDEKFGRDTRLKLAVKNLRDATTLDYDRVSGETAVEREARDERQRREEAYGRSRMADISREFDSHSDLMERNVAEAKQLLLILVPSFVDEDKPSTLGTSDPQEHGYGLGDSFTVQIKNPVPEIVTDDSNIDVVRSAIDVLKQLIVHKKKVDGWMRIATKYCRDSSINQYIRLRNLLKSEMDKLIELSLRLPIDNPSDGEDEDEFIDVLDDIDMEGEELDQPGTSTIPPLKGDLSIRRVDFGLDLKYWGQKKTIAQVPVNNADCHRFWRPPDESEERNDRAEAYETRVFTYIGEEQRGKMKCRARLKNGELCPRMDISKCPVHGKIIDRDNEGFPTEEQADMELKRDEETDDDYMDDVEAQIGRSLRGKETKKDKKKKKERNDRSGKAVRERLEAKLLNPRTIKRVSAVLDEMRMAKIQKKFGDQHAHRNL